MNNVYVVYGHDLDYDYVVEIFATEELAEKFVQAHNAEAQYSYDEYYWTEFTVIDNL